MDVYNSFIFSIPQCFPLFAAHWPIPALCLIAAWLHHHFIIIDFAKCTVRFTRWVAIYRDYSVYIVLQPALIVRNRVVRVVRVVRTLLNQEVSWPVMIL